MARILLVANRDYIAVTGNIDFEKYRKLEKDLRIATFTFGQKVEGPTGIIEDAIITLLAWKGQISLDYLTFEYGIPIWAIRSVTDKLKEEKKIYYFDAETGSLI